MGARRYLKVAAALTALLYCSLLVYQNSNRLNFQEKRRAVRQSEFRIEPVTLTSSTIQKKGLTDDVFISVKTTKYYQDTRLPIILKTWFQLAKEQVR